MCSVFTGCAITITPITYKEQIKHQSASEKSRMSDKKVTKSKKDNSWLIVDSNWLVQYRALEEEHGNYILHDDSRVEAVGGGKYKVTRAMMNHFRDLSQALDPK